MDLLMSNRTSRTSALVPQFCETDALTWEFKLYWPVFKGLYF